MFGVLDQTKENGISMWFLLKLYLHILNLSFIFQSRTVLTPSTSLTEAALLMQSRKSDADVDNICEICPSLTPSQILKLIKSYTPDDCEEMISPAFIDKLAKKLCAVSIELRRYSIPILILK